MTYTPLKQRCQCNVECSNIPEKVSALCKTHSHRCSRISPMTGYEPEYKPIKYNKTRRIRHSHNCFAYAFDHIDIPPLDKCNEKICPISFHQPGTKSGFPKWNKVRGKRCPDLISRLRADVPGIVSSTFTERCPDKHSKIALVVAPESDYHFYRQDSNGYWSHKPGSMPATNLDASGHPIYDPALANRLYMNTSTDTKINDGDSINYDTFCTYMCIPKPPRFKFKRGGCATYHKCRQKHKNNVKLTRKCRRICK